MQSASDQIALAPGNGRCQRVVAAGLKGRISPCAAVQAALCWQRCAEGAATRRAVLKEEKIDDSAG